MPVIVAIAVFLIVVAVGLRPREAGTRQFEAEIKGMVPKQATGTGLSARVEQALRLSAVRLTARQAFVGVALLCVLLVGVAYRMTGNLAVGFVIGAVGVAYPLMRLRQFEQKRRDILALQFKEALTSILYSLRAGASLQTAMERALTDLTRIYPGGAEPIVLEFRELAQQLRLGMPVENVLTEWADRIQMEEVADFVSATLAVKSRGGNLAEVMATISETITWKIVAQAQIRAMTAEKRAEANMLTFVPPVVLVALSFLSPHYIAPLFDSGAGQIVLLIGVICNVLAFLAVRKVLESPL